MLRTRSDFPLQKLLLFLIPLSVLSVCGFAFLYNLTCAILSISYYVVLTFSFTLRGLVRDFVVRICYLRMVSLLSSSKTNSIGHAYVSGRPRTPTLTEFKVSTISINGYKIKMDSKEVNARDYFVQLVSFVQPSAEFSIAFTFLFAIPLAACFVSIIAALLCLQRSSPMIPVVYSVAISVFCLLPVMSFFC
jgi:hypothetical protein